MRKILSANLSRLWMNRSFWLTVIFTTGIEVVYCLLLLRQGSMPMDYLLFLTLPGIGIFISVFYSLFLGTEYSDGTIRNKLIVGHHRSSIYLASLFTGIIAVTVLYLAVLFTGGILGALAFAAPHFSAGTIARASVIGWLACVSYAAIFNFTGMLSASKARTSILCILTAFILMLVGLTLFSLLNDLDNTICLFLFEINPFGQTFLTMSIDLENPWRLAGYALLLSTVLTGLGLYLFRKKDLK